MQFFDWLLCHCGMDCPIGDLADDVCFFREEAEKIKSLPDLMAIVEKISKRGAGDVAYVAWRAYEDLVMTTEDSALSPEKARDALIELGHASIRYHNLREMAEDAQVKMRNCSDKLREILRA